MNSRDIWLLYRHELRSALRERAIVVNSILVPVLLYPVILWGALSVMTLVRGLSEGATSRVAIHGLPAAHEAIRDSLAGMARVELARSAPATLEAAEAAVGAGELDAVLVFEPATGTAAALPGNFTARIVHDQSEDRSRRAAERVRDTLDRYRSAWLEREVGALAIAPERLLHFDIARNNVASDREMGAFMLSLVIPLLLVFMVALGCFYPAIDSTAGERERATWETLMTVAASRSSVLLAKYLYVATFGIVAGLLNVVAMLVTIGALLGPLVADAGGAIEFTVPMAAVVVMAFGAIAMALLFAALMMILASFARTFKEGQAMIMPVYFAAILPVFFVSEPDIGLDAQVAVIPVANVMLMIKDAFQGIYQWPWIAVTLLVSLALVAGSLTLARWVLGFEALLLGSYDGTFWKFIRERARRKEPAT
jgi:sodium transport system permease protein